MSRQQTTNREHGADTARANILTNGGFEIWQRGPGPVTYGASADRWDLYNLQGTAAGTFARDTTNHETGSACLVTVCTNVGTAFVQQQRIENWRDFKGKPVSLKMRIKSPVVGGVRVSISDGLTSTIYTNTTSGAYETISITHNPVSLSATQLWIQIEYLIAGTYYLDSAMLVPGMVPTDYVPLHPADDLARCQRYYEILGSRTDTLDNSLIFAGYAPAGGATYMTFPYKVQKAAAQPTVTKVGSWGVANCSQPTVDAVGAWACRMSCTATAAGQFYANANVSTGCYMTVEANV